MISQFKIERRGRKPKPGAKRTQSGQLSRAGEGGIHPETLSVRERELKAVGLILEFTKQEGGRTVNKRTAEDRLSGYTLGQLWLRKQQDRTCPGSISEDQFEAGEAWASLVIARKTLDESRRLGTKTPSFSMVAGGGSSGEPDQDKIDRIRKRWQSCEDALNACAGDPVWKIKQVLYGVCVENWPIVQLSETDLGQLRTGLNAVGRALR